MALSVRREELASLHDEWVELLDQHPDAAPFIHPTWQRVWLEEFQGDRELLLYSVRDGDSLVGIAPLLRDDGRISFVGHYSMCDYMDFVVTRERGPEFYPAIVDALLAESWSELELRGLRDGSPTLTELPTAVQAAGLAFEREEEAVAPHVATTSTWDEHVASLSKKNRHEVRRKPIANSQASANTSTRSVPLEAIARVTWRSRPLASARLVVDHIDFEVRFQNPFLSFPL